MTAEAGSPLPMTCHEAARLYATHGWRVVPIAPKGKHPHLEAWQTNATSDLALIDAWYTGIYRDHGVGLLMGSYIPPLNESRNVIAAGQGHVFALDVDITDGKLGQETLRDLEDSYSELPETVEQQTGSGGRHLLYRAPEGVEIRNDAGRRLGPGLDIRGIGGQIVAAPTIHPNGQPYAWIWECAPWERQVADAPGWLTALLTREDDTWSTNSNLDTTTTTGSTSNAPAATKQAPSSPWTTPARTGASTSDRPGDRFNQSTTWPTLLENDGWTRNRDGPEGEQRWTRPGKGVRDGISATVGYKGSDVLKVFTSSVPALEQDRTYDRFGYWAATRHHGNIAMAAIALNAEHRQNLGELIGTWTRDSPPGRAEGLSGPAWQPTSDPTTGENAQDTREPTSWAPVDLTDALAGIDAEPPTILHRTDGPALLYPARTHWFQGEPESLKTWVALAAIAEVINNDHQALMIDFEDDDKGVVARLRALGLTTTQIAGQFAYVRPEEPLRDAHGRAGNAETDFAAALDTQPWALVVIDGVTEAMTVEGLDLNSNTDVATFMRRLPKRITTIPSRPAVICLDHVTKNTENRGRWAIGGQHKLAGITGATYAFDVVRPLSRALIAPVEAIVTMTIQKDRPGHVRAHAVDKIVSTVLITSYPDGSVAIALAPPSTEAMPELKLCLAILTHLSHYEGASTKSIEDNVTGKATLIRGAIAWMVAPERSWIEVARKGASHAHTLTERGREMLTDD